MHTTGRHIDRLPRARRGARLIPVRPTGAQGTWKSAGHVPGYAGHVPMGQPALQPGEGRSLDKSEALFKDNYKAAYDGYRGVSKLVPPQ